MKIYLACPYSHEDIAVRHYRFEKANLKAAVLMLKGNIVFSPISHSVPIGNHMPEGMETHFKFWMKQDLPFIDWCDELWVLTLDGAWQKSEGVNREIEYATELGKRIKFTGP